MNRKLPLFVAIAALAALLVPTAAFPFGSEADTELQNVAIAPSDGPNGVYAEIDDGRIRLDLSASNQRLAGDGINENSITVIDNVLRITYTGSQNATVWLTHDGDGDSVQFYRSGSPGRLVQGEEWGVALQTNETLRVGMLVDTTDPAHGVEEIESFTVHAVAPEDVPLSVETTGATGVDDTSAALGGTLDSLGGTAEASVSFEYRESGETGWNTLQATTMTEPGSVNRVVTGLAPGTTYEFRAVAAASGSSDTGGIETFTTSEPEPPAEETPSEEPPETPTQTPPETPTETPPEAPSETPPETPTQESPAPPADTPTAGAPGGPTAEPTPTPTPTPPVETVPAQTRSADRQDPDQASGVTLDGTEGGLGILAGVVSNTFLLLLLALLLGLLVSRAVRELADEEE
jgi:hypothetical protein